jgi:tripartite ATP-independent transporter DctP family solute receptor
MSHSSFTRRQINLGLAAAGSFAILRPARASEINLVHSHNLPVESPLHKRATELWAAVARETNGRVEVKIDRGADGGLDNLIKGNIAFVTLAGNGIAATVPAADVQATPYGFRNPQQVYRALDGALGAYLRGELKAKGIYALPGGCFENGMHQITSNRPIRTAADLKGLKMRVPGTPAYQDFFKSLGAEITTVNLTRTYDALKSGQVEAQDDPWDVVELFKFYEVQKYGIVTDHSWSGYNMLASQKVWSRLPQDVQRIIEDNTRKYVALQRADTDALNVDLRRDLQGKGMMFIEADQASFRASLGAFYPRWKAHIGQRTWDLLEAEVGRLG